MEREPSNPQGPTIRRGFILALTAAGAFGVSVPLVQRASEGSGSFAASGLLYAGAALAFGLSMVRVRPAARGEASLTRRDVPVLLAIAGLGAMISPALFVWGLARTSGVSASLLLNAEGAFTVLLAALLNRERLGARLAVAVALVFAGSALVVIEGTGSGSTTMVGALAVALATLGWATDSTLASRLSGADPRAVVVAKCSLGALLCFAAVAALGEPWPHWRAGLALLGIGSISYGLSLRLYLEAQRILGAARSSGVFCIGPFVGALAALALGERPASWTLAPAAALLVIGVWMQLVDRHEHPHHHHRLAHDHQHRHDDGHHAHHHDVLPAGPHSHPHEHDELVHHHPHVDDVHHRHRH